MNWTFDDYTKWSLAAVTAMLAWLFKGHEARLNAAEQIFAERAQRIQALELTRESKEEANQQREGIRRDLHAFRKETGESLDDMRSEIGQRMEVIRTETNDTLKELSAQISSISTARRRK